MTDGGRHRDAAGRDARGRPATDGAQTGDPPRGESRRSFLRSVGAGVGLAAVARPASGSPRSQSRQASTPPDGSRSRRGGTDRSTSPPPGPPVLYDSVASAPQLENDPASRWTADPLLVCGTDAYVDGEYLYQDYVFDDYGADTAPLSTPAEPNTSEKSTGDVRYPTDADRYAFNAADLLEFRATPTPEGVAYRIRLNTMLEPDAAGIALGIDRGGPGDAAWGYGIGDLGALALDHVLCAWGETAELDGEPVPATVDLDRNQIEATVPLAPGDETWRHYLVVGLFDAARGRFKPVRVRPSATHPGGSNGGDPPPIFNVGFRFDEPLTADPPAFTDYREAAQATALAARDIERFHADVDFSMLHPPTTTEYDVPESGFLNRLYASRLDRGAGADAAQGAFTGRVQPYGVYVPTGYDGSPTPLHLDLHSGTNTHNDFAAHMPNRVRQFGADRGAFVVTPLARSTRGFYLDDHEYAVFEAWNDLAARYAIDDRRVTIGGHSMGSYGTYWLAASYPDLFAGAFTTTGAMGDTFTDRSAVTGSDTPDVTRLTDNLRHVPLLFWYGALDELAPIVSPLRYERQLRDHGYRHELDVFTADHFTWPQLDRWAPARAFLDAHGAVTRTPARVTYRRVPAFDDDDLGLVRDGAYWLSDVRVGEAAASGRVDVASAAVDAPDPIARDYESAGTEPLPHVARGTRWERPIDRAPPRNRLDLSLADVSHVTIWVEEADLDPREPLQVRSDSTTRATITLAGSFGTREITVPAGRTARTVRLAG